MDRLKQIEKAIEELSSKCTDPASKAGILLDDARVRCLGARALLAVGDLDDGEGIGGLTPAARLGAYAARDAALALEALAQESKAKEV